MISTLPTSVGNGDAWMTLTAVVDDSYLFTHISPSIAEHLHLRRQSFLICDSSRPRERSKPAAIGLEVRIGTRREMFQAIVDADCEGCILGRMAMQFLGLEIDRESSQIRLVEVIHDI